MVVVMVGVLFKYGWTQYDGCDRSVQSDDGHAYLQPSNGMGGIGIGMIANPLLMYNGMIQNGMLQNGMMQNAIVQNGEAQNGMMENGMENGTKSEAE